MGGLLGGGAKDMLASLQNYWGELSPPPPCSYAYVNLRLQGRIRYFKKKYCDKTVDAQIGPHLCIWRESARALTHVRKQIISMICHKEKKLKMIKVVTLGE